MASENHPHRSGDAPVDSPTAAAEPLPAALDPTQAALAGELLEESGPDPLAVGAAVAALDDRTRLAESAGAGRMRWSAALLVVALVLGS